MPAEPGAPFAVVLAAGASSRLGRPKALVTLQGRTVLAHLLDSLRDASVTHGVVVVGTHADEMRGAVDPAPLSWVVNPDPAAGRTGSLQRGLAAMQAPSDILLWPVDRPLGGADVVRSLCDARVHAPTAGWLVPVSAARRGHPILIRASLLPALRAAPPSANLREVLRATGTQPHEVPVEDPLLHLDLDTEQDIRTAERVFQRR